MKPRLFKGAEPTKGYISIATTHNSELKYLEFGRLFLPKRGDKYRIETENREAVLAVLTGECSINIEMPSQKISYKGIGSRSDVFSGKPTMVYVPREVGFTIVAETDRLEVGLSFAPSESDFQPVLVKPEDAAERFVGAWNWSRKVYTCIGDNIKAERLLAGETISPSGNWSSSPPHKHDSESLNEVPLEEVYFFKVKPVQGFGLQRIYTTPEDEEPFDEVYVVENNDTVVIPRGYHPVVAAPGYQLYYLWVLAGEKRKYGAWTDDPKHKWLKDREPMLRDILHLP